MSYLKSPLWAISAVDGRYQKHVAELCHFWSEGALHLARLEVEKAWLEFLLETPTLKAFFSCPASDLEKIKSWTISPVLVEQVARHEKTTNHDVKAVEYTLREALAEKGVSPPTLALVHFACTSEDINNVSYALLLERAQKEMVAPLLRDIDQALLQLMQDHAARPMLSRTHGQPASPTTLGKELAVFQHRLKRQKERLASCRMEAKFSGAVGNYNAHTAALPEVPWAKLTQQFLSDKLGLVQNPLTTQIENHDSLVEYASILQHYNTIALGLCRDIWAYISLGYFGLKMTAGEVGSSTMPHKVNPIDFENAEGNLGVANALLSHYSDKLPVSRWQRDLSDSTVLRTLGTAFAHCVIGWKALLRGLGKIAASDERLQEDLNQAWEVLGEALQTVLRRYGQVDAYEQLKSMSRGKRWEQKDWLTAVESFSVLPKAEKERLKKLTPSTYTGLAEELASK